MLWYLKKIKHFGILLAFILFMNGLVGCTHTQKYVPEKFAESDLAIYDSKTKKEIKLYMKKDEIDKILGTKGESTSNPNTYNYFGLSIYYRDNSTAVLLDLKNNEAKRFSTIRKISTGNTKTDIIKVYGDFITSDRDLDSTSYYVENRDGVFYYLKYASSPDKTKFEEFDKDKTYIITFYYDEKDIHKQIINRISIFDYKFGLDLK